MASSSTTDPKLIAVVGAAGPTGLAALAALAREGLAARALVHRSEQGDDVIRAGASEVEVIELDDPKSLARAFHGATAVHYIPPVFTGNEPEQVARAIRASSETGVERFVLHSVLHPSTLGVRHHERKAQSEAMIRRSGLQWTILQPAMYAQTMKLYLEMSPAGSVIVPYSLDTPFTPIDLHDVAAVTAVVHRQEAHEFATYELAGSEVLTTRQMMALLADGLGVDFELRCGDLSELSLPAGWSAEARMDMAAMCEHYDSVGLSGGSRVATMLLGRAPVSFAQAISA